MSVEKLIAEFLKVTLSLGWLSRKHPIRPFADDRIGLLAGVLGHLYGAAFL